MAIWYILWPFGIFYGHLVYFMAIWYILWPFGIFFQFLNVAPSKIWQPWSYHNFNSWIALRTLDGLKMSQFEKLLSVPQMVFKKLPLLHPCKYAIKKGIPRSNEISMHGYPFIVACQHCQRFKFPANSLRTTRRHFQDLTFSKPPAKPSMT
jgi:hypothetical protein